MFLVHSETDSHHPVWCRYHPDEAECSPPPETKNKCRWFGIELKVLCLSTVIYPGRGRRSTSGLRVWPNTVTELLKSSINCYCQTEKKGKVNDANKTEAHTTGPNAVHAQCYFLTSRRNALHHRNPSRRPIEWAKIACVAKGIVLAGVL